MSVNSAWWIWNGWMLPSKKNLLELSSWNHDHRKAKRDLNQNGNGKKIITDIHVQEYS